MFFLPLERIFRSCKLIQATSYSSISLYMLPMVVGKAKKGFSFLSRCWYRPVLYSFYLTRGDVYSFPVYEFA